MPPRAHKGRGWAGNARLRWSVRAALLIVALALVIPPWRFVSRMQAALPAIPAHPAAAAPMGSRVLAADGTEIGRIFRVRQTWIPLDAMSPNVIDALLATEDHRFFEHGGVDIVRLAGAAWYTMLGDPQGASTVPMQLARGAFPSIAEGSIWERKTQEMLMARRLVREMPREAILEWYLNTVPFGYNTYGIEAAAERFFSMHAADLSVAQSALLVGMLKGTSRYDPFKRPSRALDRRATVIGRMFDDGRLTLAEARRATAEPLALIPSTEDPATSPAPHFLAYVKAFVEFQGLDAETDGLTIHTTLDLDMQAVAVGAAERQAARLQRVVNREWSPEERLSVGMVALEPGTAFVRAWVGDLDWRVDQYDKVGSALRQPGSTFKPFLYAAALEAGFSPWYMVQDRVRTFNVPGRGNVWTPTNSGGGASGRVYTLRDGLVWSKNTVAAHVMSRLGPARVAATAERMGIASPLLPVPSLALGTSEVTLLELTGAYGTIASGGVQRDPIVVTHVTDRNGRTVASFAAPSFSADAPGTAQAQAAAGATQALEPDIAYTLLDMMRGVVDQGTGSLIRTEFGVRGDLAGKTGTTQNNADGWFVLMHPDLVVGAWVGFNDPATTFRSNYWGQGGHNALLLVGDFMRIATRAGSNSGTGSSSPLVNPRARFLAPPGYRAPAPPVYNTPTPPDSPASPAATESEPVAQIPGGP
ncbi:MAG: transglycosylase domain-containing protein [Rhodothermales bacterium]